MLGRTLTMAAAVALMTGAAFAETHEVHMLTKGAAGSMVFEPAYIAAQPGDTIHFVAVDKGHNVASIDGMLPDGVADFKSKMNKDFELTVDAEGLYGVKCTPHYGMGMVALIQVGAAANRDAVMAVKQSRMPRKRFETLFAQVQ